MSEISNLAVIDPSAQIGSDVTIAPFCVVGSDVVIEDGCQLMNNVTVQGITRIGRDNVFYPNVVIGVAPQDLKYNGAPTETIIGKGNVFRENTTVHRGTEKGGGKTVIGSGCLFMVAVHIAHDCILENKIILGNQTQLAGHVHIEEGSVVSALVGLHHFVRVGKYSYVGGLTPVHRDIPPFVKFSGDPNEVRGVNEEGLKRNGFSPEDVALVKQGYRQIFRRGNSIAGNVDELLAQDDLDANVRYMCEFVKKSCDSRFGRYHETFRSDSVEDRRRRRPLEVRGNRG